MKRVRWRILMSGALVASVLLAPTSASAHERRTIANGKYDVVVGWDVEPAYQGLKNAASIRITQAGSDPASPVQGADKTLKVQMRQGGTSREFPLRAVFGQAGYYVADLLPTRAGDYQWTFAGSIGGDTVNEVFDSADGKFNGVEALAPLQFPLAEPDGAQLAAIASTAQAEAQAARTLAYAGIGLGILGVLAAVALWLNRSRALAAATRPSADRS